MSKVIAPASVALALTLALAATASRALAGSDAKAVAVAEHVMRSLGGESAWNATRYLRFDFAVERGGKTLMRRAHTWDKWSGRYRVEAKDKSGKEVVVTMNLNTKQGSATLGGVPLAGEALKKALDDAYAWWVNDTYWLLMPYKMRDPGVSLSYVGASTKGGVTWDEVALRFGNVGLTPKDRYWVFVNRATGLVDRWEFVLNGAKTPPVPFEWRDWKSYGGIRLADERVSPKDGTRIYFPVLDAPASVPDATFGR